MNDTDFSGEYADVLAALGDAGVTDFGGKVTVAEARAVATETGAKAARRARFSIAFETTTLYFDTHGRYLGRAYMDRDECERWTGRAT